MLIAIGGLIASGKSSVARETVRALGAAHVEADVVRDQILKIPPGQAAHETAWSENLAAGTTEQIYRTLLERAEAALEAGSDVVVDGCFALRDQREAARRLARAHAVPFLFVECRAPRAILEDRLRARSRAMDIPPEAWLVLLDRVEKRYEFVDELDAEEFLQVDSEGALESIVAGVIAKTLGNRSPAPPKAPAMPIAPDCGRASGSALFVRPRR